MPGKKSHPFLISLSGIVITILVYQTLVSNENVHIKSQIDLQAKNIALEIQNEITSQILALKRMADRWDISGKPSQVKWVSDAKNYVKHSPHYQAIEWVDPSFHVRWIVPLKGNEQAQDLDLSFEQKRKTALVKARNMGKITITRPVDLVQGGKGFLIYFHIYHKNNFEGFILGVFNIEKLFNHILEKDRSAQGFSVSLFEESNKIYSRYKSINFEESNWTSDQPIKFYNANWRLQVWPNAAFLGSERSSMPTVVLVLGLLMAFLTGITYFYFIRARKHAYDVATTNHKLLNEISERKKIEDTLQKAHDELELKVELRTQELKKSNRDLEDFASIASHDLKEPLRKIITFGDRLSAIVPNLNEKSKNYLERMQLSAERMQRLIGDLLEYSKLTSVESSFRQVNIEKIVRQVVDDLDIQISQTLAAVVVKDLPTLEADSLQMCQLFQNLIGNALKYHRDGIPPNIRVESSRKDNGVWEITVKDNGIGFDEKYKEKIFKPFERLHGRSSYEGTGMGLAICKKIMGSHGGSITARSQPQNGTTFILTFPETQNQG